IAPDLVELATPEAGQFGRTLLDDAGGGGGRVRFRRSARGRAAGGAGDQCEGRKSGYDLTVFHFETSWAQLFGASALAMLGAGRSVLRERSRRRCNLASRARRACRSDGDRK